MNRSSAKADAELARQYGVEEGTHEGKDESSDAEQRKRRHVRPVFVGRTDEEGYFAVEIQETAIVWFLQVVVSFGLSL